MGDHRDYKKRIKSYAAQIKYVDSVFEAEICKPVEQRDEALLSECLDTLDYLHDSKRKLIAKLETESSTCVRMAYKRPRLVFATIIALVILLGTGVAQALGFRIWSALIHWDAGYLHVNYVPEEQEPFDPANGSSASENGIIVMDDGIVEPIDYLSVEDALSELDIEPMLPTYLPENIYIDRIYGYYGEGSKTLNIRYENQVKGESIFYSAMVIDESESTATVLLPGDGETHLYHENKGTTFILSQSDSIIYVTWTHGNIIYSIDANVSYAEVLNIVDMLAVYEKQ